MSSAAITLEHSVGSAQTRGRAFRSSCMVDSTPIVFVLDEDTAVLESLERLVHREGWHCATFASEQEFVTCRPAGVPNCLVLDALLPGTSALELQKRIAAERPGTSIIFVASRFDMNTTVKAIKAGAVEFFKKPFRDDVLLTAIREALERSRFALGQEAGMRVIRNCYTTLTPRERQVMELLVSGLLNKQVGGELGIGEHTVKVHRSRVMQKMQADSFAHLVRIASKLGVAPRRKPGTDAPSDATFV